MKYLQYTDCENCPLKNSRVVYPQKPQNKTLAIIGEAPGVNEEIKDENFVGESGRRLDQGLKYFNIPRKSIHISNALMCRAFNLSPDEWKQALNCCRPRLEKELQKVSPDVIFSLGKQAFQVITPHKGSHMDWIGSHMASGIEGLEATQVISSIHPAWCMRGLQQYFDVFYQHLEHAVRMSRGETIFEWPELLYYGSNENRILEALQEILKSEFYIQ